MKAFTTSYTDLHCDTPYEIYKQNTSLLSNNLHVSLERASRFDNYTQVMAVWSDCERSDEEAYKDFFEIQNKLLSEIEENKEKVALCLTFSGIKQALSQNKSAFILSVEDARILSGDISRLEKLYLCGVRFLTLQWEGESCIGGGYDKNLGLTDFGHAVVQGCFELGIIPDISHACERTANDILDIAQRYKKSVAATHSNSRVVCNHPRNLSDAVFKRVADGGGIIGLSLYPPHLSDDEKADTDTVLSHLKHWISVGGEESICLGCDFDGIKSTPSDIKNISDMAQLYNSLEAKGFPVKKIFSENANLFLKNNL